MTYRIVTIHSPTAILHIVPEGATKSLCGITSDFWDIKTTPKEAEKLKKYWLKHKRMCSKCRKALQEVK